MLLQLYIGPEGLNKMPLTKIGLNLPGFVERNKVIASLPSLSLLTLAALTPNYYEQNYIEIEDFQNGNDLPDDFDLVAISSYSFCVIPIGE